MHDFYQRMNRDIEKMRPAFDVLQHQTHLSRIMEEMNSKLAWFDRLDNFMKPTLAALANQDRLAFMSGEFSKSVAMSSRLDELTRPAFQGLQHQSHLAQITRDMSFKLAGFANLSGMMKPALEALEFQDRVGRVSHELSRTLTSVNRVDELMRPAMRFLGEQSHLERITREMSSKFIGFNRYEDLTKSALEALKFDSDLRGVSHSFTQLLHPIPQVDRLFKAEIGNAFLARTLGGISFQNLASLEFSDADAFSSADWTDAMESVAPQVHEIASGLTSLSEKVEGLIRLAERQNTPILQKVVAMIVMNVVWSIIVMVSGGVWEGIRDCPHVSQAVRTVRAYLGEVRQVDAEEVRVYRIVARRVLFVRAVKKSSAEVVGVLLAGDIVRIESKQKKWRRVVWWDEESFEYKAGWVLSKCLKKL